MAAPDRRVIFHHMNKEKIKKKLDAVLNRLGMDTSAWHETISPFREKLELLFETNKYNKLLKALFASNDLSEFNSYVFEVLFAYDFQSKKQSLLYEVTQSPDQKSSVDFYYEINELRIYIELRLVQQRAKITKSTEEQLAVNKCYEILLNGEDEADETVRLQNIILSKCQKPDGTPIKFYKPTDGNLNFIAINLSELHLGMIDKYDCLLTLLGDRSVPLFYRRKIFGMWQELPENLQEKEQEYYEKFQNFREVIHGVLFVRYVKDSGYLNRMYIDRELEYFAILNNNLVPQETCDLVIKKLSSFLKVWPTSDNKK